MLEEIFSRTYRLLGSEVLDAIGSARVIVFGVGGVGSWCAECLVRTGVKHLTIVDGDNVSVTNRNRQLMATSKTVGLPKVEVLAERLREINPDADILPLCKTYTKETAADFLLDSYDYIIDAIDSLKDKICLILHATSLEHPVFFSSMGAALRIDPFCVKVAEFWKVRNDPLGAMLRKRLRQKRTLPQKKFMCVYSDELPMTNMGKSDETCDYKAVINGSLCHITGIFGFALAGLVIKDIKGRKES